VYVRLASLSSPHRDGRLNHANTPPALLPIIAELIGKPRQVAAADEPSMKYVGRASTGQTGLSIAHLRSPPGWAEPPERLEFDEFTIVLQETLGREDPPRPAGGSSRPRSAYQAGPMGYGTPGTSGAKYISACLPLTPCHNPTGMTNPDQAHEPRAPSGMSERSRR